MEEYRSRKCPVCGKTFSPLYIDMWAYKDKYGKRWYCSWGCLRADEGKPKTRKPYTHKAIKYVTLDLPALEWLLKHDSRSSTQISKAIGHCASYLYNLIERRRKSMPESSAKELAEVLNCDMAIFVTGAKK